MIDRDQGVLDVIAIATQNPHVKDVIQDMMWNATDYDFEEASSALLQLVRGCIENSNYEMLELEPGLVPYQSPLSAVAIHTKRKINQRARSGKMSCLSQSHFCLNLMILIPVFYR